jgi:hypothetical protein
MVGIDNRLLDTRRTPVTTDVRAEVSSRLAAEYADRFSAAETQELVDRCWQELGGAPTFGTLGRISRRRLEDLALHARVGRAEFGITASRGRTIVL